MGAVGGGEGRQEAKLSLG